VSRKCAFLSSGFFVFLSAVSVWEAWEGRLEELVRKWWWYIGLIFVRVLVTPTEVVPDKWAIRRLL